MVYSDKQLREIFHFLFLERLLRLSDPRLYVLKGGVNLRFFFRSPRYSEDMDLDVLGGNVETLKKNSYKILEDAAFRRALEAYGIESVKINDPAKAKQTETTQRFRLRLMTEAGEEFPTKVEFSRRQKVHQKTFVQELVLPEIARPYKRLSFACQHYSAEFAVVQKILALGGRAEVQARDVFDLFILYLGGHLTQESVQKNVNKMDREKACLALLGLDYDSYQGQVVEYLEPSSRDQFGSEEAWENLCQTILGVLE